MTQSKLFAPLYTQNTGRPNFPVNILLSLEYFKHIYDYTGEELINQFYYNVQIAFAMGIKNVGEINLGIRTLYYFRKHVYEYILKHPQEEDLIFGQFIKLMKEFSLKAGVMTDKQRMDSTLISSNIKKAGRLALALDVLEKAIKKVPHEFLSDKLKEVTKEGYTRTLLYKTKSSEIENRLEHVIDLCVELKEIIQGNENLSSNNELLLLERLLNEQTVKNASEKGYKIKRGKDIAGNSLQSAYDVDATYRKKAEKQSSGYVLNISETCDNNNEIQLITDYVVEKNIVSDVEIINSRLEIIKENTGCKEIVVDGGYYGKRTFDTSKDHGIIIKYTDMTGGKPDENKTSVLEFKLDEDNKILRCPANIEPLDSYVANGASTAHFIKSDCEVCEKKEFCIAKPHKDLNTVRIEHDTIKAEKTRSEIETNKKTNVSSRAAIEGTISELKRKHGADETRVRGLIKTRIVEGLKITACNIKRFIIYMQEKRTKVVKDATYFGIPVSQT